jgi:hypothetical protein
MTRRGDSRGDMRRSFGWADGQSGGLDERTAERLLRGGLPVDDAPPRFRGVAQVISLVGAPPLDDELAREAATVARIAAVVRQSRKPAAATPKSAFSTRRTALVTAGAALATMTLFSGLAVADALPAPVQTVASTVLAAFNINVPDPGSGHGNPPAQPGVHASPNGQGSTVSGFATDPNTGGVGNGSAVSNTASNGKSQAGEHGKAGENGKAGQNGNGAPPASAAPTTTAPPPTTAAPTTTTAAPVHGNPHSVPGP